MSSKLGIASMSPDEVASRATRERAERVGEELLGSMDDAAEIDPTLERSTVLAEALGELLGAGAIDSLLDDPEVSEVLVDGPRTIHVIRRGAREKTDRIFSSEPALIDAIRRLVPGAGPGPVIQGVSPRGDRVVAVLPPASAHGPSVSVRRAPSVHPDLDKLVSSESLSREMADFLHACLGARRNVLVTGDVASGKTTLLDALAGSLPAEERVIVIEPELEIERPGWVTLRPSAGGPPGDLVLAALAMRPDRLVVSDLSGPETYPVLRAIGGRLRGSLLSVHAYDAKGALSRLATLASLSNEANPSAVRVLVAEVVDAVALVERQPDGKHRVTRIDVRREDGVDGYGLEEAFTLRAGKFHSAGAASTFFKRTEGSD